MYSDLKTAYRDWEAGEVDLLDGSRPHPGAAGTGGGR